jgi:hypothetical protein
LKTKDLNKENMNMTAFKAEIEDLFTKLDNSEHLRQVKENTNLSLLSKINIKEPSSPSKRDLISHNNKRKLESDNSYFAMNDSVARNRDESRLGKSFYSYKSGKEHGFNSFKDRFNGSQVTSILENNKLNEKSQHDASVRRFMKKVVTRILKRIYLSFTTSRLPNAIEFRDFSEFNLSQVMDEKLPSESYKK